MLWWPGILPTYFLVFLSTIPLAAMMTGMASAFFGTQCWDLHTCSSSLGPSSWCLVTSNDHIYDFAPIRLLLLYDCVWFVAGDMFVSDWVVQQDSCLLNLYHSFRLMLIPALCFHFHAIVLAYVQMQLGCYLVVPVKVLICH